MGGEAGLISNQPKAGQNGDLLFAPYAPLGAERSNDDDSPRDKTFITMPKITEWRTLDVSFNYPWALLVIINYNPSNIFARTRLV